MIAGGGRLRETIMAKIMLTASDGFESAAHEAKPADKPRGGLVVIQEIFGVNAHIRKVADEYAADGYHVVAPGIFERAERNFAVGYEKADADRGVALRGKIPVEKTLLDIAASIERVKAAGKVGIVGYCYGGSLAWLSATRLQGLSATIGYYGGMIAKHLDEKPRCPVMLHFGEMDTGIPMADVEQIKSAVDPGMVQVFTYPAGHAFNRDGTPNFNAHCAMLARMRTVKFLQEHVG
jgi:carboxymethylenebutenolidase